MAKPPVSDHDNASDHLKTWILKVYIHCEGCKKKVIKILQSIDGVYKTVIDAKEHKVTVTGSVTGDTLVQKLLKSGKPAEILPESFEATPPKKKKQSNKQKDKDDVPTADETEHVDGEKEKSEDPKTDGGNDQKAEAAPPAETSGDAGKKKKKKKKKVDKGDTNLQPKVDDTDTALDSAVAVEKVGPEEFNLGPPLHYGAGGASYDMMPLYNTNYYPTPAYGMSYNTSYPSTESSYYTPPMYGYAQSHPHMSGYYPPLPPPSYRPRSAFDDHDDENEGRLCTIM